MNTENNNAAALELLSAADSSYSEDFMSTVLATITEDLPTLTLDEKIIDALEHPLMRQPFAGTTCKILAQFVDQEVDNAPAVLEIFLKAARKATQNFNSEIAGVHINAISSLINNYPTLVTIDLRADVLQIYPPAENGRTYASEPFKEAKETFKKAFQTASLKKYKLKKGAAATTPSAQPAVPIVRPQWD